MRRSRESVPNCTRSILSTRVSRTPRTASHEVTDPGITKRGAGHHDRFLWRKAGMLHNFLTIKKRHAVNQLGSGYCSKIGPVSAHSRIWWFTHQGSSSQCWVMWRRPTSCTAAMRISSPSGVVTWKLPVRSGAADVEARPVIIETPGRRIGLCWRAPRAPVQGRKQAPRATSRRPRPLPTCFWPNAKNAIQKIQPLVHDHSLNSTHRNSKSR